jgi:hypothetical protein
METLTIVIELKVTSLSPLSPDERTELVNMLAKQVTPIPMLPYGVTTELKSVGFAE